MMAKTAVSLIAQGGIASGGASAPVAWYNNLKTSVRRGYGDLLGALPVDVLSETNKLP